MLEKIESKDIFKKANLEIKKQDNDYVVSFYGSSEKQSYAYSSAVENVLRKKNAWLMSNEVIDDYEIGYHSWKISGDLREEELNKIVQAIHQKAEINYQHELKYV